jgi:two-component sensor histidine kinase
MSDAIDGVVITFVDITERRRAEDELKALTQTLEHRVDEANAELRKTFDLFRSVFNLSPVPLLITHLADQTMDANASYRAFYGLPASEPFDGVGHAGLWSFGIRYRLTEVRDLLGADSSAPTKSAVDALSEVDRWVGEAIQHARRMTVDLSPPILGGEGLTEAMEWLVTQMAEMHGLRVTLESRKQHQVRDPDLRILLYQTVRELLFNVVKHAQTDEADVVITEVDGAWQVAVSDAGVGFDPHAADGSGRPGFGIRRLRERLKLFGGGLELSSRPGDGTKVIVRLPVPDDIE